METRNGIYLELGVVFIKLRAYHLMVGGCVGEFDLICEFRGLGWTIAYCNVICSAVLMIRY